MLILERDLEYILERNCMRCRFEIFFLNEFVYNQWSNLLVCEDLDLGDSEQSPCLCLRGTAAVDNLSLCF